MKNYSAVIEYDGTCFKGFQLQPGNLRTVQGEILKALNIIAGNIIQFSYAGRTDSGVHAKHQVINFITDKIPDLYRFKWQLNCLLPEDIVIKSIKKVNKNFDARKDALLRQYRYYVVNNNYQSVFLKKYSMLVTQKLDMDLMQSAAEKFIGEKDFACFSNCSEKDYTLRKVYSFSVKRLSSGLIEFKIEANSFLYNMVRIIIGTIIEIGKRQRDIESIDSDFMNKKRAYAGKIADAKGLFLTKVIY